MLGIVLKILSIVGIVLLALLLLAILVAFLVLFFPFTYRVQGCRDPEGLRLQVKVNWLFGLFRVRYRYPEPGRLRAKAFWFSLIDLKLPPDRTEAESGEKKACDADKSRAQKGAGRREKEARGGTHGDGKSGLTEDREVSSQDTESRALETAGSSGQRSGDTASLWDAGQDQSGTAASANPDRDFGQKEPETADGSDPKDDGKALGHGTGGTQSESASEDEGVGAFGKISQKLQKIKYTICSIYDKIKKIWENISYYIELLQEENTKQLTAHAMKRARKILKRIRPSRIRARLLFGTGSPDTTGYLYGGYCMISALYGGAFVVTPDFEQKRFEGEFDIAGHVIVWTFVANGAMLLLDRRLYRFLKKLKRGQGKARKASV